MRRRWAPAWAALAAAATAFVLVTAAGDAPDPRPAPATTATPGRGPLTFARMGCGSCHTFAAAGAVSASGVGPDLDQRLDRHTAASVRAQILTPRPTTSFDAMPSFAGRMSDADLDALVAFLLDARR